MAVFFLEEPNAFHAGWPVAKMIHWINFYLPASGRRCQNSKIADHELKIANPSLPHHFFSCGNRLWVNAQQWEIATSPIAYTFPAPRNDGIQ